ncbi:MAG: cysteine-S-conjugate beta-lyase [Pseudonocardiales bacterium]|nr:cysteine-S-conjugate beta-lyase [Pseudonocardiales bacterium]
MRHQAAESDGDPYGFNSLSTDWLRSKASVKWHRPGADVLPAWIADMDFPLAPPVRAALDAVLDRGDLGYPEWFDGTPPLAEVFARRMAERYDWAPDPAHARTFDDLIQIVQLVLHLTTAPGDGVALHVPNYPPFLQTLDEMNRPPVPIPMEPAAGGWTFDPGRLADAATEGRCRTLLLVNPQNPTGRVFTRSELAGIAEVVVEHDLLVVVDEVHADLAYPPNQHIPFASLGPEVAERTVTISSATKAFNMAGVRCAIGHFGPPTLRATLAAQPKDLFGVVGVLGMAATVAAWTDSDDWLAGVRVHLRANRDLLAELLADQLPGVRFRSPEATYLAWLDCRELGLAAEPAEFFRTRAGVELSPGPDFGPGGVGYARLNFATSAGILTEIVDRMSRAVRGR